MNSLVDTLIFMSVAIIPIILYLELTSNKVKVKAIKKSNNFKGKNYIRKQNGKL